MVFLSASLKGKYTNKVLINYRVYWINRLFRYSRTGSLHCWESSFSSCVYFFVKIKYTAHGPCFITLYLTGKSYLEIQCFRTNTYMEGQYNQFVWIFQHYYKLLTKNTIFSYLLICRKISLRSRNHFILRRFMTKALISLFLKSRVSSPANFARCVLSHIDSSEHKETIFFPKFKQ